MSEDSDDIVEFGVGGVTSSAEWIKENGKERNRAIKNEWIFMFFDFGGLYIKKQKKAMTFLETKYFPEMSWPLKCNGCIMGIYATIVSQNLLSNQRLFRRTDLIYNLSDRKIP